MHLYRQEYAVKKATFHLVHFRNRRWAHFSSIFKEDFVFKREKRSSRNFKIPCLGSGSFGHTASVGRLFLSFF
jgi:hypothetical protein